MGSLNEIIMIIFVFVMTQAFGQEPKLPADKYVQIFPGYFLKGHVIGTMKSSDLWTCVLECHRTPGCLSFNTRNASEFVHCELMQSNRTSDGVSFMNSPLDQQYLELIMKRDDRECPLKDGWKRFKAFDYKYVNEVVNAATARQRCRQLSENADLVSINDAEEDSFALRLFNDTNGWSMVWIGINDIDKEGAFVWWDGTTSTYRNWMGGEPNGKKTENCVQYFERFKGRWVDNNCQTPAAYICKIPCYLL